MLLLVLEKTQRNLLQMVGALRRRAASRAACTAGSNKAIKIPMIVMTTRSSTSVKPLRDGRRERDMPPISL